MGRLGARCEEINRSRAASRFDSVFVDQEGFETYRPVTFGDSLAGFREYK
jgi:type III restriction enzyme